MLDKVEFIVEKPKDVSSFFNRIDLEVESELFKPEIEAFKHLNEI